MTNKIWNRDPKFHWICCGLFVLMVAASFEIMVFAVNHYLHWMFKVCSYTAAFLGFWFVLMTFETQPWKKHIRVGLSSSLFYLTLALLLMPGQLGNEKITMIHYIKFNGMVVVVLLALGFFIGSAARVGDIIEQRWFKENSNKQ